MRRGAEVEEAIMLKRIALLVAMAALTIVKPSNAVAQGWDGCCGITVNVGFPFQHRDFCCERRFFPRRVDCCEERRDFCCEDRRFFPRRAFEERRDFDAAPRPPAGIPGGYYNAGYAQ